jgi:hypothetical protein
MQAKRGWRAWYGLPVLPGRFPGVPRISLGLVLVLSSPKEFCL